MEKFTNHIRYTKKKQCKIPYAWHGALWRDAQTLRCVSYEMELKSEPCVPYDG